MSWSSYTNVGTNGITGSAGCPVRTGHSHVQNNQTIPDIPHMFVSCLIVVFIFFFFFS
jgi:hypothetical protein